jgi:hypothetical protein
MYDVKNFAIKSKNYCKKKLEILEDGSTFNVHGSLKKHYLNIQATNSDMLIQRYLHQNSNEFITEIEKTAGCQWLAPIILFN